MLFDAIQIVALLASSLAKLYGVLLIMLMAVTFFGDKPYWYNQSGMVMVGRGIKVGGKPIHEAAPVSMFIVSLIWKALQWPVKVVLAWLTSIGCLMMDVVIGSWAGIFGFKLPGWCADAGYEEEYTADAINFGDVITDAIDPVLSPIKSAVNGVKNAVESTVGGVTDAIDSVVDAVSSISPI